MEKLLSCGLHKWANLRLALRQLWRQKWISMILVIEIVLSVIMLAQLYVFLLDYGDNLKATKEFPEDALVLATFDYYDNQYVMDQLEKDASVREAGSVATAGCYINGHYCRFAAYPPAILSHYTPPLKAGSWLMGVSALSDGIIPCVTTGSFDEHVGDIMELVVYETKLDVRVIGILASPSQILYPTGNASTDSFSIDMITTQDDIVIIPYEYAKDLCQQIQYSHGGIGESVFIFTDYNITDLSSLRKYGELTSMKSLADVFYKKSCEMISIGLLFAFVFILLSATCILSNYITQSEGSMRIYTTYYMLGMKWTECLEIEIIRVLILSILTFLLCLYAGNAGFLMLEWLTVGRRIVFFTIVILFILLLLGGTGCVFFWKLRHADLSTALKEIHQGE